MRFKILVVLILCVLLALSLYLGGYIKGAVLKANDGVLGTIYAAKDGFVNFINEHFNQVDEIRLLREKVADLEKSAALTASFAVQLNAILDDKNSTLITPKLTLVRGVSFVQMGDYKRMWLNAELFDKGSLNKGLLQNGYAVGIAAARQGRLMGILMGDEQCVFSVYIGKKRVPGLVQGNGDKIFVNFIPKTAKIEVGDEVLTSGMDEIFLPGIPVGKITELRNEDMYMSAEIQAFESPNLPSFMYMIERF